MIGRLINIAWMTFVYGCVGTIIAQAIILAYLASAWKVDHQRWQGIIAAAQGIVPAQTADAQIIVPEEKVAEQPSYDQVLEARAIKNRNLEIREQELRNSLTQVQLDQNKLAEEKKRYKQLRDGFDAELLSMRDGATATGKEEVSRTLETIKSKQAKTLILEMLNKKEIDEVVALLKPMSDAKRAKIFGEFKTEEELAKLSEVLRRIREGAPAVSVPETTRKQLDQLKTTQL
jgi:folylpolyglutamate synthase/dihydropteroate synthase